MTPKEVKQLRIEIDHIFDTGVNEIRIFEFVQKFIDKALNELEKKNNQLKLKIRNDENRINLALKIVRSWKELSIEKGLEIEKLKKKNDLVEHLNNDLKERIKEAYTDGYSDSKYDFDIENYID